MDSIDLINLRFTVIKLAINRNDLKKKRRGRIFTIYWVNIDDAVLHRVEKQFTNPGQPVINSVVEMVGNRVQIPFP